MATAVLAGGIAILVASGAERVTAIALDIVAADTCGAAIAEDGQIIQTILAIDVSLKFVGSVGGQLRATLRADVDGISVLFVGVFVHGIILLKIFFSTEWFLLRE